MIIRTTLLTAGIAASLFTMGCESAADQQRKANEAQAEANGEIAEARRDADEKARKAQAEANGEIAAAQKDFAKLREDYRHDLQTKLADVDQDIAKLRSRAVTETGKKKAQIEANLPIIEERRSNLSAAFLNLETASASNWDHVKGEVDKRWADLKDAVASAS